MDFKIRKALETDMPLVLSLIKELAVFEKAPDAVLLSAEDLIRDGFGTQKKFDCFVAEDTQNNLLGMALFYPRYSTWKGETIHLEDLIVKKEYRSQGIGKALFDWVIKEGQKRKVRRIEWAVLDWNTDAIAFYQNAGAQVLTDWRVAQMDENAILNY